MKAESKLEPLLVELGERVRSRRQAHGWTLRVLAVQSALSERFLQGLESGRANISVVNLDQLAQALGTTAAALLAPSPKTRAPSTVIALLGLRGAGKSTVGRALAARLDVRFSELDRLIEQEAGMVLPEIFALHGEDYFRELEQAVLERVLAERTPRVLSTSGGVVTSPGAFTLLKTQTRTVWLKASPQEHWARVVEQGDTRPMQNRPHAMAELKRTWREREPFYRQASYTCSTSRRTVAAVVRELAAWAEGEKHAPVPGAQDVKHSR